MVKYERPLTCILLIGPLWHLFAEYCFRDEYSREGKQEISFEIQAEDGNLNIDSMVDIVIENIDIEADVDTATEINTDLVEEEETTE